MESPHHPHLGHQEYDHGLLGTGGGNDEFWSPEEERNNRRKRWLVVAALAAFLLLVLAMWGFPKKKTGEEVATNNNASTGYVVTPTPAVSPTGSPSASAASGSSTGSSSSGGKGGDGGDGGDGVSGGVTEINRTFITNNYITLPAGSSAPAATPTPNPTPTPAVLGSFTGPSAFRSARLGTSKVAATNDADAAGAYPNDTGVHFQWTTGAPGTNTIRAVRILVCTTPNLSSPCIAPAGASVVGNTSQPGGGDFSGWTPIVVGSNQITFTNATGTPSTQGNVETLNLDDFINPSVLGSFAFRVTTYNSDTVFTDANLLDQGSMQTSTAKSITVTADVAEVFTFRVGNAVALDCQSQTDIADPDDPTEDLVTLSPNPMSTTGGSTGTAQMCIISNAGHGFAINYRDGAFGGASAGFYNGSHSFPAVNNFVGTSGSEQFGFNLVLNPATANYATFGANPDGAGLLTDLAANYNTPGLFSYDKTGNPVQLASKAGPTAAARYTMAYLANISPSTPGGTYKAHQVFIATGSF